MDERLLEGKAAIVTGAGRGIGRAIALTLAANGAWVALAARTVAELEGVRAELEALGGQSAVFPTDVSDEDQAGVLVRGAAERFGRLDVLVNNAGINIRKPLTDFTLAEWRQVMDTNLTSAFLMCRSFVPHLRGQGYGRILNLTSIMSHVALPGRTAYAASKTGLLGFTRALALELAPEKITVNGISPGPIATEMNTPLIQDPELNREFISKIPLRRWGRAEEVGQLALYLCSEEAGFITGADILIDGGWTAQ